MQRTVFDRTYTPGRAAKIAPNLEALYPPREFEHVVVKVRVGTLRRHRIVIQRKKRK